MLLIHDDKSLSVLKEGYTFSYKGAEEDWDRSIRLLKKLSEANKAWGTHLEAQIKVVTRPEDDEPAGWIAFEWCWSIGSDWSQRHHTEGAESDGVIDDVSYIPYYAGVKDCISQHPTIRVDLLKSDQDWEMVERAALATLLPPNRE